MRVKLLVVQGRPHGQSLYFPCGEFVIGRGAECHIRPNSSWVSRQHCILTVTDTAVHLRDLGSRNGTLVNGSRVVGERRLLHGDRVQLGPLVLQLCLEESSVDFQFPAGQAETGSHRADTSQERSLTGNPPSPANRLDEVEPEVFSVEPPTVGKSLPS
jgi:pSer/pThr/pTyr-binding forkhead associated (FHA) protein